jgi:hypothetical protein
MDYALPHLFVVPVGNTLPTTGSTQDLTDGKFGVFQDKAHTVATAGTVTSAQFVRFAQGRPALGLDSKKSAKIFTKNITSFIKTEGKAAQVEIWDISDFNVPITDSVTLTLVGHSRILDGLYYGGFRRSYTVPAGCLECGDDPCTVVSNEDVIDAFIAKYNDDVAEAPEGPGIPAYYTFTKVGTGDTAVLRITAKPKTLTGTDCDLALNPFDFDRMWFVPTVFLGPATSADQIVDDACPIPATLTLNQKSSFAIGTAAEIKDMEKRYYSYASPNKVLYTDPSFDPYFISHVDDSTTYNLYTLDFNEGVQNNNWNDFVPYDERVLIAVPAGSATDTAINTIMTAFYQAATDESGIDLADIDKTIP